MEMKLPHRLGADTVKERLESVAREHDLNLAWNPDATSGTIEKKAPMMGVVRASFTIRADVLDVTVTKRPALLPEGTLRRMLESELERVLAL